MATMKGTAMAAGAEGLQIPPYDRAFFDEHHEASLRAARAFLGHLFGVWRPRSVLDVGCGSGAWLRARAGPTASYTTSWDVTAKDGSRRKVADFLANLSYRWEDA